MNAFVVTPHFSDGVIAIDTEHFRLDRRELIMRQVVNLQDTAVRDALTKLGWVSPDEAKAQREDALRYRWLRDNGSANEKRESRAILPVVGRKAQMAFRYWVSPDDLDKLIDSRCVNQNGELP